MPLSARDAALRIAAINVKLIAAGQVLIKAVTRDKREPDRLQKERLSRFIYRIIRKRFKKQFERLRFQIQLVYPGRAGKAIGDYIDIDSIFEDDEEAQDLIALILAAAQGGIKQNALLARLQVDYGLTNAEAAQWARRYSYELIKDLDKTTASVIRSAVTQFVDDPGYTMRDLFELLEPEFGRIRAERIAVTEVTRAYSKGQQLAGDTLKEQFPGVKIVDKWYTNNDDRVCELCGPLDGEEREHGEGFYPPEDYADGYPPRHVNCILPGTVVSAPGLVAAAKSFYVGRCVEIILTNGSRLSCTENHPILTSKGWVKAKELSVFDNVITCPNYQGVVSAIDPNNQYRPAMIEEVFSSLVESKFMLTKTMKLTAEDFNGDGRFVNGNVDIVFPNRFLGSDIETGLLKKVRENFFSQSCAGLFDLVTFGPSNEFIQIDDPTLNGAMRRAEHGIRDFGTGVFPSGIHGIRDITRSNIELDQSLTKSPAIDTSLLSQFLLRFPRDIAAEQIVKIRYFDFSGHVYDLQCEPYELYFCNTIITHNCRCWVSTSTRIE